MAWRRQLHLMRALVPNVRRASQTHLRLRKANLRERRIAECIEHLPTGIVLIDGRGRVHLANAAARAVLEQDRGLSVRNRQRRCADPVSDRALRGSICSVVARDVTPAGAGEPIALETLNRRVVVLCRLRM